jgi:hypothetical protein
MGVRGREDDVVSGGRSPSAPENLTKYSGRSGDIMCDPWRVGGGDRRRHGAGERSRLGD